MSATLGRLGASKLRSGCRRLHGSGALDTPGRPSNLLRLFSRVLGPLGNGKSFGEYIQRCHLMVEVATVMSQAGTVIPVALKGSAWLANGSLTP